MDVGPSTSKGQSPAIKNARESPKRAHPLVSLENGNQSDDARPLDSPLERNREDRVQNDESPGLPDADSDRTVQMSGEEDEDMDKDAAERPYNLKEDLQILEHIIARDQINHIASEHMWRDLATELFKKGIRHFPPLCSFVPF